MSCDSNLAPACAADTERPPTVAARPHDFADYHQLVLGIAICVLVAACLLQVRPDQRVAFRLFPQAPLPEVCQSKVLLGIDCPGCGLTRSFVHLAHGDLAASLGVHPVGWLVALFVLAQVPYRIWALRTANGAPLGERTPWVMTAALVALLFASWLARLLA